MEQKQTNSDLVWDLEQFSQRKAAEQFVRRFENKLCVYSGSVEQIYTNYSIFFPEDENRNMVILPDPYAHHDTIQGVREDAVRPTGLTIIPGELVNKQGLHLTIPVKTEAGRKIRVVPLQQGLKAINGSRSADKPLLPVLMKGDLREVDKKVPALHLHSIDLDRLTNLSALQRSSIREVIVEKLPSIK